MSMHRHADPVACHDDCVPRAPTRNHYFTGKLLVERDFVDEQWYFREKIRLHHQRLHGTGVVCGLRIRQHPNASCQDRLIILEPGSAIDCCGHDILVPYPETFDISGVPAIAALIQAKDARPHVLEFCLEWRECPTEEIPVLYDECGCDDTQCAPNRILESFELKVKVDPPAKPAHFHAPKFDWDASIALANSTAVALDEANGRVFVVAGAPNGTLYQVDIQHLTIDASLKYEPAGAGRGGLTRRAHTVRGHGAGQRGVRAGTVGVPTGRRGWTGAAAGQHRDFERQRLRAGAHGGGRGAVADRGAANRQSVAAGGRHSHHR